MKGERLPGAAPFGHWQSQTFIAALRCHGLTAPWLLEGAMDRAAFDIYIETQLAPTLQAGDVTPGKLSEKAGRSARGYVVAATRAAFSQESVLVPMTSVTRYTLSLMRVSSAIGPDPTQLDHPSSLVCETDFCRGSRGPRTTRRRRYTTPSWSESASNSARPPKCS